MRKCFGMIRNISFYLLSPDPINYSKPTKFRCLFLKHCLCSFAGKMEAVDNLAKLCARAQLLQMKQTLFAPMRIQSQRFGLALPKFPGSFCEQLWRGLGPQMSVWISNALPLEFAHCYKQQRS